MTNNSGNSFDWLTNYQKVVDLYHAESDRGAAVLAGSLLDECLEDCIKAFLIEEATAIAHELFEGTGPLATFYAKELIAFSLGLISQEMKQDLKYIRKVRNHFAHSHSETTFEEAQVRSWCSNLSLAKPIPDEKGEVFQEHNPRLQYLFTIGMTILRLYKIAEMQQKRILPTFLLPK
jgi:mannitol operon repressor